MNRLMILTFMLLYTTLVYSQHAPNNIYLLQDVNPNSWEEKRQVSEDEVVLGQVYRIIQFKDIPSRECKEKLASYGVKLLEYIPKYAYLSSIPETVMSNRSDLFNDVKMLPVIRAIKEHKTLTSDESYLSKRNFSSRIYNVHFYQNIPASYVTAALEKRGYKIDGLHDGGHIVRVNINSVNDVSNLLNEPFVKVVSRAEFEDKPEDFLGLSLHRSSGLNNPYSDVIGYEGSGIGVQVRDDGYVGDHIDFQGRIRNLTGDRDAGGHGDMVAGIITGAGNLNPYMQGMAPDAELFVTNYQANFTDNTLELHLDSGVYITNSSYSNGCNAGYTFATEQVDMQIYENQTLLHVFSAGNSRGLNCDYGAGSGWATITGGHKQGKNVIATANLRPNGVLETSSSWGPGHDGRIKPEVAANGTLHFSTAAKNTYREGGGTSAAAPGVAGVCAQLYEAYNDMYGALPKSALIKSTLMNTANDLGLPGPDYKFGYGHINAVRAYELLKDRRWEHGIIEQGESINFPFEVTSDMLEVRIMLYWPDRPASLLAEKALVSDMDLQVTDNNNGLHLPVFPNPHKFEVFKVAETGIDSVNNVEQIVFKFPEAGNYNIKITGKEIPFDEEEYYVLYEVIEEPVKLTFPVQNAVFAPEELVRIHWDAVLPNQEYITIEYREGNGAWMSADTMTATAGMYHWNVPPDFNKSYQMRLATQAGAYSETIDFHVWPLMSSPKVSHRCGGDVTLSWKGLKGAAAYEIFALEDRKMTMIMTVKDTFGVVSDFESNFYAVRGVSDQGFTGLRGIASFLEQPIISDCRVNIDMAILGLNGLIDQNLFVCETDSTIISVQVQNLGRSQVDSFRVSLENANTMDEVSQVFYQTLSPGERAQFSFSNLLAIEINQENLIRAEVYLESDESNINDAILQKIIIIDRELYLENTPYSNSFSSDITDGGWSIYSDVDEEDWDTYRGEQVDGENGFMAMVAHNFSLNDNQGLRSPLLEIQDDEKVFLKFHIAYDAVENIDHDIMDIYITTLCGDNTGSRELFASIRGSELQRKGTGQADNPWQPNHEENWDQVSYDISTYAGETVVFDLVVENRNYNTIVIDNFEINTEEQEEVFPSVRFVNEDDCKPGPYIFEDNSYGVYDSVRWFFGTQANPVSARGPGPHSVSFPNNTDAASVRLNVYKDGQIIPTSRAALFREVADASFDVLFISNNTVQLTPNQLHGTTNELWYLGDGNRSREDGQLIHTYPNPGTYTIMHTLATDCNIDTFFYNVTIDKESAVIQTEDSEVSLEIYPVPANDYLRLIHSGNQPVDISIKNINGKRITDLVNIQNDVADLNTSSWPAGMYVVTLNDGKKLYSEKIVIVH